MNDEPRWGNPLVLAEMLARVDVLSVAGLCPTGVGPDPTPIRPAIAESRSSISVGITGAGGLGRRSAPKVVFAREGLLVGGKTTEGRAEVGPEVETSAERGGGRGRGAHPVRRGSGFIAGRGEIVLWRDGEEEELCGDPAANWGDIEGGVPARDAEKGVAEGGGDERSVVVSAVDVDRALLISTIKPRSLEVTSCAGPGFDGGRDWF